MVEKEAIAEVRKNLEEHGAIACWGTQIGVWGIKENGQRKRCESCQVWKILNSNNLKDVLVVLEEIVQRIGIESKRRQVTDMTLRRI